MHRFGSGTRRRPSFVPHSPQAFEAHRIVRRCPSPSSAVARFERCIGFSDANALERRGLEDTMGLLQNIEKQVGLTLGIHAGPAKVAIRKLDAANVSSLEVTSVAFSAGHPLPKSASADGAGLAPPISWRNVPPTTRSIVLICEDPDAPFPEPFVHWLVYGIPASVGRLDGSPPRVGREGKNSASTTGFTGAAPPPGHGTHHYHFQVFALDIELDLEAGANRSALFEAIRGHVLACGDLVGTYERGPQ